MVKGIEKNKGMEKISVEEWKRWKDERMKG